MRRIPLDLLISSLEELSRFRKLLGGGGVAAIPTDTYYGLAADPRNTRGVDRTGRVKGREESKPLPVLFSARAQLEDLGVIAPAPALDDYFRLWPAPLTVVLPIRQPIAASYGRRTLAVRCPASPHLRALLQAVGPLTATSLNRAGDRPIADPQVAENLFQDEIDLLVDGGHTPGEEPSTLVDATVTPPKLLRPGAFPWR